MRLYDFLGRIAYLLSVWLISVFMRRTTRAYVLIVCEGKVLVVKNWLSRQNWQLPGGGVHRYETTAQAVIRELHEELKVDLTDQKFKQITSGIWETDNLGQKYTIITTKLAARPAIKTRRWEIIRAAWLPVENFNTSNTSPEILAALRAGGL